MSDKHREGRVQQFKRRWRDADKRGEIGHRVEYALEPLLAVEAELAELKTVQRGKVQPAQLAITWQQMVIMRDTALEANDFQRAFAWSQVCEDLAHLIQAAGAEVPPIPR